MTPRRARLDGGEAGAERIAKAIRAHWDVENGLHSLLDVAFEDDDRKRNARVAENLAIIDRMAFIPVRRPHT